MNKQTQEALKMAIVFLLGFLYSLLLWWIGGLDFNVRGFGQAVAIFISTMSGLLFVLVIKDFESYLS
jgi:hypothetical protein